MNRVINWVKGEPVRARLYSLTTLVSAYLVSKDVIDVTDAAFIGSVAGIVLAVETARRKVSPTKH